MTLERGLKPASGSFDKKNIVNIAIRVILVLLPWLSAVFISFVFGHYGSLRFLVPSWNDEIGWYSQVEAVIKYGRPLGYWGYNEGQAQIGTFGPWGIAPLLPYALFGKIFGWQLNTMALANISFLSVSLLLFLLLTRPTNKQVLSLIVAYLSLFTVTGFSLTSMSECLRYACAVILAGFIVWTERRAGKHGKKMTVRQKMIFALGCIFLFYCIQVYIIFSFIVFVLPLLMLRGSKVKVVIRVVISAVLTAAVAVISNMLIGIVAAPYFNPSVLGIFLGYLKTDPFKGIGFVFDSLLKNLETINFPNILDFYGMLIWYFLSYFILLVCLIVRFVRKKERFGGSENISFALALFFLLGFLAGYLLLYAGGTRWTFWRGTNTGLILALLLLAVSDKSRFTFIFASFLTLFSIVGVWSFYGEITNERYTNMQYAEEIGLENEKEKLSEIIRIDPEADAWDNTLAIYGRADISYCALPAGIGFNTMFVEKCEKAKYAVMPSGLATKNKRAYFYLNGYDPIYTDELFAVFEKDAYPSEKRALNMIEYMYSDVNGKNSGEDRTLGPDERWYGPFWSVAAGKYVIRPVHNNDNAVIHYALTAESGKTTLMEGELTGSENVIELELTEDVSAFELVMENTSGEEVTFEILEIQAVS